MTRRWLTAVSLILLFSAPSISRLLFRLLVFIC